MKFNLDRDLVFLDIESTGLNVLRDRIVQIAMIKHFKNGQPPGEMSMLINPGIPISEESYKVHGISVEDVRNKPTFQQVADEIFKFIGDSDLAGYNSDRFDVPMLMEEFARMGIEFDVDSRRCIDVQKIFYKMEPRTLRAAYKFYCEKELDNAHDALADVQATVDVLKGQIHTYQGQDYEDPDGNVLKNPVKNDMESLYQFTRDPNALDVTQRLKYNSLGEIVFNFGKYTGKPIIPFLYEDKQYYNWMLEKEFSSQVKQIIKKVVKEYARKVESSG